MNVSSLFAVSLLALSFSGRLLAAGDPPPAAASAASSPAIAASGPARARSACESAVDTSIRDIRGPGAQDVQFAADAQTAAGAADHVNVKGSGHYRRGNGAPIPFRYSCEFDSTSETTSGVLFHEVVPTPPAALPVWRADLSALSPADCESAAAAALQAAHPRASGIVFDTNRRQLEPGEQGRTALVGTGRLVRAPGMAPGPFRYRCEFDANGRVVSTNVE